MLRRLRIYFTGFGIGLILVYFMFLRDDSRDLDIWTPSQRILEDIRNDSIFLHSGELLCFKDCLQLSDTILVKLWTDATVKSLNPGGDPYRYLISLDEGGLDFEAEIELQDKKRTLLYLRDRKNPGNCACDR